MLKVDWYLEQPIDFEYKNYILLDYIQDLDRSYQLLQLSPYLLWTEKLVNELKDFEIKRRIFLSQFDKKQIVFEDNTIRLIKKTIEQPESIKMISDIIDYSTPLLESKVKFGYKLLNKYPQIIW